MIDGRVAIAPGKESAARHMSFLHVDCENMTLMLGAEAKPRQLQYSIMKAGDMDDELEEMGLDELHRNVAGQEPAGEAGEAGEADEAGDGDEDKADDGEHLDFDNEQGGADEIDEMQNMLVACYGEAGEAHRQQCPENWAEDTQPHTDNEDMLPHTDNEEHIPPGGGVQLGQISILPEDILVPASTAASSSSNAGATEQPRLRLLNGEYATPDLGILKLLLPPKPGCTIQRRAPDGVIQVWWPNESSKTFRFAPKGTYTNSTLPRRVALQALRDAADWAWEWYGKEVGKDEAERVFEEQVMKLESLGGIPESF